jgi:hypothetical protein
MIGQVISKLWDVFVMKIGMKREKDSKELCMRNELVIGNGQSEKEPQVHT